MSLAPDHIGRQQTKGLWSRCGWLQSPFPQPLPGCWRSEHWQKEITFLPGVSKWVLALMTPDIAFYFDGFLNFLMKIFLASCSYFWVSSCHNTYSLIIRLWAHWELGPNFIPFLPSFSCFFHSHLPLFFPLILPSFLLLWNMNIWWEQNSRANGFSVVIWNRNFTVYTALFYPFCSRKRSLNYFMMDNMPPADLSCLWP